LSGTTIRAGTGAYAAREAAAAVLVCCFVHQSAIATTVQVHVCAA